MPSLSVIVVYVVFVATSFIFVFFIVPLIRLLIRQHASPLRNLPGPPCPSFFMGNLKEMHDQENTNLLALWEHLYGPTFVYRGFIGSPRLMTTDPVAIAHVLAHAYEYPKPDFIRDNLASMAAGHDGLLTVEGDQHRRQRKILTPAFSKVHLASLTPVFWEKALQLRDIWLQHTDMQQTTPRIDALGWLSRATLDVIGEAALLTSLGFGYHFNSLSSVSTDNELAAAFSVIFSTARKFRVITILQVWFPILRRFRTNNTTMIEAQETMHRIGTHLIDQKRTEILSESSEKFSSMSAKRVQRDLLSLLIRSNLTSMTTNSGCSLTLQQHQMSTNEVLCQISTFLAAGHETTASALTWCLYALARAPGAQVKLRAALRAIVQESEEGEAGLPLHGCEYLDWVVRETLRLHAPVTSTMRVCMRPGGDDIPLSIHIGKREKQWSVHVGEGDLVTIPISAVNKSKRLWGEDADEFRPERWADPPEATRSIPGLLGGMLTFLNGNGSIKEGNRACIGWRFAMIELIKIFLYTLVKDLSFSIDEDLVIEKRINIVTRPFVKSEPLLGNQMPLRVRRPQP